MSEVATGPSTKYLDPAALAKLKNLGLAARSALVNAGYVAQAKSVDVANAAFVTAIKLIAAIVV